MQVWNKRTAAHGPWNRLKPLHAVRSSILRSAYFHSTSRRVKSLQQPLPSAGASSDRAYAVAICPRLCVASPSGGTF
eukprot:283337-Chlamydomonas_euryale.AAC.3